MPKKTKKEKIIAELRRRLETTSLLNQKPEVGNWKWETETGSQKMEISLQNISLPNPTSHVQLPAPSSLIFKDLRKTFILAGLAISFEVVLYILWK